MIRKTAAVAATALAALAITAAAAPAAGTATTGVTVTMTEFKFVLSKKSVPRGTVVFKVVNKGKLPHDFRINGKGTPDIAAGKSGTLRVVFKKAGKYKFDCTIAGHAPAGMKGVLVVR